MEASSRAAPARALRREGAAPRRLDGDAFTVCHLLDLLFSLLAMPRSFWRGLGAGTTGPWQAPRTTRKNTTNAGHFNAIQLERPDGDHVRHLPGRHARHRRHRLLQHGGVCAAGLSAMAGATAGAVVAALCGGGVVFGGGGGGFRGGGFSWGGGGVPGCSWVSAPGGFLGRWPRGGGCWWDGGGGGDGGGS